MRVLPLAARCMGLGSAPLLSGTQAASVFAAAVLFVAGLARRALR